MFVSSRVAIAAVPQHAVYAAAKAGVHSFARSLRASLAGTAIRVVEVLPPVVDTDFARTLDVPKIRASAVADALIDGMRRDKQQIAVGQIRPLLMFARLAPRLADELVQRALQPRPNVGEPRV